MSGDNYTSRQREPIKVGDRETESHGSYSDVGQKATDWLRKRGLIANAQDAHAALNVPGARYGRRGGSRAKATKQKPQ